MFYWRFDDSLVSERSRRRRRRRKKEEEGREIKERKIKTTADVISKVCGRFVFTRRTRTV